MRRLLTLLFVLGAASTTWAEGPTSAKATKPKAKWLGGTTLPSPHYLEHNPPMYFPEEPKKDSQFLAVWERIVLNPTHAAIASLLGPIGTLGQRPLVRTSMDANSRMELLLRDSEDLRQARKQVQQFWLNNPPQVIEFERPKNQAKPGKQ